MEIIKHELITWHVGTRQECEQKAAELGYAVDTEGNATVAHAIGRVPGSVGYIRGDVTALLIPYDTQGRWCFQTRNAPRPRPSLSVMLD